MLPNPEESANFFSRIVFWWIQSILAKGYKAPLEETDIFSCHTNLKSKTLTDRTKYYWDKEMKKSSPSLSRALIKANNRILIITALQCFVESVLLLAFHKTLIVNLSSKSYHYNHPHYYRHNTISIMSIHHSLMH